MRERMPTVAKWIDELREVFGRESIDQALREDLKSGKFFASENGYTIGSASRRLDSGGST